MTGAHFVHTLVTRYNDLATNGATTTQLEATIYETPDASKEALNLLTLIAELYNAGVIGSGLIYDLIRGFLGSGTEEEVMAEREVEALLKVLRCMCLPLSVQIVLTIRLRTATAL
jgi:nucleolar MIF4G domain-containing protein 1